VLCDTAIERILDPLDWYTLDLSENLARDEIDGVRFAILVWPHRHKLIVTRRAPQRSAHWHHLVMEGKRGVEAS
jgi:hypothetical protein